MTSPTVVDVAVSQEGEQRRQEAQLSAQIELLTQQFEEQKVRSGESHRQRIGYICVQAKQAKHV